MKSIIGLLSKAKKTVSSFGFWPKDNLAKAAVYTLLAADILDIISTVVVISLVTSAHETNPFMVDSVGSFLVWKAIKVKALWMCWAGLLGYGFQRSTGFKWAYSLPFLYLAASASVAAFNNFLIYVSK
jgi:hypothetical protein